MTDRGIDVTHLSQAGGLSDVSLWGLVFQADWIVQSVMLLLLLVSIFSWSIIFNKLFLIRRLKAETVLFQEIFWSGEPLEKLATDYTRNMDDKNTLGDLFMVGMNEWSYGDDLNKKPASKSSSTLQRVEQMMGVHLSHYAEKLSTQLSFLASIGSNAVFVGLFGTVWGIMTSFQSVALSQNTSLAVVAPGIAEALLATAMGLIAAIPAVIFYNKLTSDIDSHLASMEAFIAEFITILSRHASDKD